MNLGREELVHASVRHSSTIFALAAAASAGLLVPPSATAQVKPPAPAQADVTGRVLDGEALPVGGAELRLLSPAGLVMVARSDSAGSYTMTVPRSAFPLSLEVRRMGYRPRTLNDLFPGQQNAIVLEPAVAEVRGVLVMASVDERPHLREFREHRARSKFGHFFDEERIRAERPRFPSDLMRHVTGMRLVPSRLGNLVRARGGCRPMLWVNGVPLPGAELDETLTMASVQAVEVYTSTAGMPAQYNNRGSGCGAIVVWVNQ